MADENTAEENDVAAATRRRIEDDPFVNWLDVELRTLEPGYAEMELTVAEHHTNFHGILHGGVTYSLADSAAGAAGNADGDVGVGLEANMSYLSSVEIGSSIRAVAERTHRSNSTQEYQVDVLDEDGERVATYRGRTYHP